MYKLVRIFIREQGWPGSSVSALSLLGFNFNLAFRRKLEKSVIYCTYKKIYLQSFGPPGCPFPCPKFYSECSCSLPVQP